MSSRKKNSARNIFSGLVSKIVIFLFAFICRTVFVRLLGAEYTGVNGLYSNILSVLALADLGIGNVFYFSLYQHLVENDEEKLSELIGAFRKLYICIGIGILSIGLLLIPILPLIIHSSLPISKVILYYVLFLINSASSYFYTYKTTVLIADQKQYINNIWTTISQSTMYLAQVLYLFISRDYTGYLIIQIVCTIGKNLILSRITEKEYPFVRRNSNRKTSNSINISELWSNIRASFLYKICTVMLTNTDNILISVILGTVVVGYYSNYYMLIQYISAYVYILTSGLHASVGNYLVDRGSNEAYSLFGVLSFVYASLSCVIISAFIACIQQFVPIWVGKEYVLNFLSVIAILSVLYIDINLSPVTLYREAIGLYAQVKFIMIPAVVLNVILSVLLGKTIGLAGIIFSTAISKLITCYWYEPMIIYKRFNKPFLNYLFKQIKYFVMTLLSCSVVICVCRHLSTNIFGVVIRACFGIMISICIVVLFCFRSEDFKNLKPMVLPMIKKRMR